MTAGARSRRGEGYRLRARLVEAASAVLEEAGDADRLSIRAVVKAAGVTAPSLYRHFPDKDALLRAVLEQRFGEFQQALAEAASGRADPMDALRAQALAYLRYGLEHPGAYRVMFSAVHAGPDAVGSDLPHPGRAAFDALVAAVDRCLPAAGADVPVHALQLWSTLHGAVDLRTGKPEIPWPPPETVVDLALLALANEQAAANRDRRDVLARIRRRLAAGSGRPQGGSTGRGRSS